MCNVITSPFGSTLSIVYNKKTLATIVVDSSNYHKYLFETITGNIYSYFSFHCNTFKLLVLCGHY